MTLPLILKDALVSLATSGVRALAKLITGKVDEIERRGDDPPQPLTYKDVEHIRRQVDAATNSGVHSRKTDGPRTTANKPRRP